VEKLSSDTFPHILKASLDEAFQAAKLEKARVEITAVRGEIPYRFSILYAKNTGGSVGVIAKFKEVNGNKILLFQSFAFLSGVETDKNVIRAIIQGLEAAAAKVWSEAGEILIHVQGGLAANEVLQELRYQPATQGSLSHVKKLLARTSPASP